MYNLEGPAEVVEVVVYVLLKPDRRGVTSRIDVAFLFMSIEGHRRSGFGVRKRTLSSKES